MIFLQFMEEQKARGNTTSEVQQLLQNLNMSGDKGTVDYYILTQVYDVTGLCE